MPNLKNRRTQPPVQTTIMRCLCRPSPPPTVTLLIWSVARRYPRADVRHAIDALAARGKIQVRGERVARIGASLL